MADSNQSTKRGRLELIIAAAKAFAWPLFGFAVLVSFWTPLQQVAGYLPSLLARSEAITIAGMSIKLDKRLQPPSPDVSRALEKISPQAVDLLLSHHTAFRIWDEQRVPEARAEMGELAELGLVKELPQGSVKDPQGKTMHGVEITPLGQDVRRFLIELIAQFVKELRHV